MNRHNRLNPQIGYTQMSRKYQNSPTAEKTSKFNKRFKIHIIPTVKEDEFTYAIEKTRAISHINIDLLGYTLISTYTTKGKTRILNSVAGIYKNVTKNMRLPSSNIDKIVKTLHRQRVSYKLTPKRNTIHLRIQGTKTEIDILQKRLKLIKLRSKEKQETHN